MKNQLWLSFKSLSFPSMESPTLPRPSSKVPLHSHKHLILSMLSSHPKKKSILILIIMAYNFPVRNLFYWKMFFKTLNFLVFCLIINHLLPSSVIQILIFILLQKSFKIDFDVEAFESNIIDEASHHQDDFSDSSHFSTISSYSEFPCCNKIEEIIRTTSKVVDKR